MPGLLSSRTWKLDAGIDRSCGERSLPTLGDALYAKSKARGGGDGLAESGL